MKLSRMSAEQLCTALCRLVPPVCALMEDTEVQQAMQQLMEAGAFRTAPGHAWRLLVSSMAPLLMQRHRDAFFAIAAALLDTPAEELRARNGFALLRELGDCWEGELMRFFPCAAGTERLR